MFKDNGNQDNHADQHRREEGSLLDHYRPLVEDDGPYIEDNPDYGPDYLDDYNDVAEDDLVELRQRRPVYLRVVALVTALAFLGLVLATSWPGIDSLTGLVSQSLRLEKDIDTQSLQAAVVKINVVARRQGAPLSVEQKSGTGFNIDPAGVIITNHHVIEGAMNMTVTFPGGQVYKADYWSGKPEFDLAVIGLGASGLPVVPLNNAGSPAPGDSIRVVGNPLGLNNIVVEGKVKQYLKVRDKPERVFSIDAPVYPGNSGSPVFDRDGLVVGVVYGTLRQTGDNSHEPVGLAVPVEEVLKLNKRGAQA